MSVVEQELLSGKMPLQNCWTSNPLASSWPPSSAVSWMPLQNCWTSNPLASVSETTKPAGLVLRPERYEITLHLSRALANQPWFRPTLSRMLTFLSFEENWNGYGELPIHESAVKRAVDILNKICPNGPKPTVVPTADGGAQLEWAVGGSEIEIEIPPRGPALILIVEPSGHETETTATAQSEKWGSLKQKLANMQKVTA